MKKETWKTLIQILVSITPLRPQSPSNEVADFVFSDVRHVPSTFLFLTANLLLGLLGGVADVNFMAWRDYNEYIKVVKGAWGVISQFH